MGESAGAGGRSLTVRSASLLMSEEDDTVRGTETAAAGLIAPSLFVQDPSRKSTLSSFDGPTCVPAGADLDFTPSPIVPSLFFPVTPFVILVRIFTGGVSLGKSGLRWNATLMRSIGSSGGRHLGRSAGNLDQSDVDGVMGMRQTFDTSDVEVVKRVHDLQV